MEWLSKHETALRHSSAAAAAKLSAGRQSLEALLMLQKTHVLDVRLLDQPVTYVALDPATVCGGGECAFLGRTRADRHPIHGLLQRLRYEAYHSLAEQTLFNLARRAVEQFGCTLVRIHHTLGEVPIGEGSVLVQVVCDHRGAAFDACRFLIDELKVSAPIWKHEQWAEGSTWSAGVPVRIEQQLH